MEDPDWITDKKGNECWEWWLCPKCKHCTEEEWSEDLNMAIKVCYNCGWWGEY